MEKAVGFSLLEKAVVHSGPHQVEFQEGRTLISGVYVLEMSYYFIFSKSKSTLSGWWQMPSHHCGQHSVVEKSSDSEAWLFVFKFLPLTSHVAFGELLHLSLSIT